MLISLSMFSSKAFSVERKKSKKREITFRYLLYVMYIPWMLLLIMNCDIMFLLDSL